MFGLSLEPLFLIEAILVLLFCWGITIVILFKQRALLRKMLGQLVGLRAASAEVSQQPSDSVDVYFARAIADTLNRYEKFTNSKTIVFDVTRPYSEKVTALRYLYLQVEKEAEEQRKIRAVGWNFYETKLEILMGLLNKLAAESDSKSQLNEYRKESKVTINRLKEIIAALQHTPPVMANHLPDKGLQETLSSIISSENLIKIRDLFEELKLFSDRFGIKPNPIEKSISTLEYEVETSDKYITQIKAGSDQEPIKFEEIIKLKESNKVQRNTISSLEEEIAILRGSIDQSASQEIKDAKADEIHRLERLVKEYEGCVIILEDQIDDLYSRLENANKNTPSEPPEIETSLQDLNAELESVSRRMNTIANDYRHAVALNRANFNFGQCKTVKEVATHIITLLKEFDISAGFCITAAIGKAEYFPSATFSDVLKKLVKSSQQKDHMGTLNGHTFFVGQRIKLIVLAADEGVESINSTISGLVSVASSNIQRLEANYRLKKNSEKVEEWIDLAKSKLANIDIQHAYQVEEGKKIYGQFMSDLKKSYELLELKGEAAILLDNAINQYDARMQLAMAGGDVIDRELAKLVSLIGTLKLHNATQAENQ